MVSIICDNLLRSKCLYFCIYGTIGAMILYQVPLMYEFGITASEIAVMHFCGQIASFILKIYVGYIADKYQIFKELIVVNALLCLISNTIQLAVPKQLHDVRSSLIFIDGLSGNSNQFIMCNNTLPVVSCWESLLTDCHHNSTEILLNRTILSPTNLSCSDYPVFTINKTFMSKISNLCPEMPQNCSHHSNNVIISRRVGFRFSLTFWLFFIVTVIKMSTFFVIFSLIDVVTFATLGRDRIHEFGFTRMFGSIGTVVFTILMGLIFMGFDLKKKNEQSKFIKGMMSISQFTPSIIMGLVLFMTITIIGLTLKKDKPVHAVSLKDSSKWLTLDKHTIVFFIFGIIGGFHFAVLTDYHVLIMLQRYKDVPKYFPGLSFTLMKISELVFTAVSPYLFKFMNDEFWISFAFVVWSIRYFGYVFASSYWILIPLDCLHGITTGLMLICMMAHVTKLADKSNLGKFQFLFSGLYFNIGVSLGSIICGLVLDKYGYFTLFIMMIVLSLTCGITFYPLQRWLFPISNVPDSRRNVDENSENKKSLIELQKSEENV